MIKLKKIEDYPRFSEVIDKEAVFLAYDPDAKILIFKLYSLVDVKFQIIGYNEMFCSYERVSDLLNPEYSDEIRIQEFESENKIVPIKEYQFIKEK